MNIFTPTKDFFGRKFAKIGSEKKQDRFQLDLNSKNRKDLIVFIFFDHSKVCY